jgi:plasmid stabilization system protein ParE
LAAIEARIAAEADEVTARTYVAAILDRCFALDAFPRQGTPREDLGPAVRTVAFRRNVVIVYAISGAEIAILAVGWRGRRIEELLSGSGT